jgi:acyl carrier protein
MLHNTTNHEPAGLLQDFASHSVDQPPPRFMTATPDRAHETSRDGDSHLQTQVIIPNRGKSADGPVVARYINAHNHSGNLWLRCRPVFCRMTSKRGASDLGGSVTVATDSVQETIRAYLLSAEIEPNTICGSAQLDELDIDSIDVVNILTELKEKYAAVIQREELDGITLDRLAALTVQRAGL